MNGSRTTRKICGLIVFAVLAAAPGAYASSVTPAVAPGSPGCADLNSAWTGLNVDGNPFGDYSDGTLSVSLSKPGPAESFDWTSNIGVTAVIAGDGSQSNVYRHDPAAKADSGVATPSGGRFSHIVFCYDRGQQGVLGARYASGTARLFSARGCVKRTFSARIVGRSIQRVVFYVDGNRVRVRHRPGKAGAYGIRVNPARYRAGIHRLAAVVEFKPWTHTRAKRLSALFERC
jgi:hypothetical protein